jgi:peptide/nickel transport system substrate-binding protein
MGGTLRVVPQGSIAIIDPHNTGAIVTGYIGRNVYEQMFSPNSIYEPKPQLVDSWQTSSDEKVWTFKLRQGLKFHNGEPMRVEDVIASVTREAIRNPISRGLFRGFTADPDNFSKAFNKVDENTFTLTLTKPTGYLLTAMAQADPYMPSVMHESIWSIKPGDPVKTAIGTGPWKFVEWVPGNRLVLEKFKDYKARTEPYDFLAGAHQVYLDKLEIVEVPDHASRVAALRTGEVHYLDDFKLDLAKTLEGVPGVTVVKTKDGNLGTFGFNHTKPPFNNKLARQAVAYAVGIETLMTTAVGDETWWDECPFFEHCGTFWSEKAVGAGQAIQTRKGNLEKARELVKQAGVEGMQVRILSSQDMPFMPEAALVMRDILEDIGFKAEIKAVDWATTVSTTSSTKEEVLNTYEANTSWSNFANGVDPLAPHGIVKSSNKSGWQDPEGKVAALRQQFMETTDVNKQIEIAKQLDATFWDEVPSLNMGMFSPPRAYRNEVQGIRNYLFPLFFEVWINK